MTSQRSTKMMIAGIIGCGVCCLALLLPLTAGLMSISILGFSLGSILCGVLFLFLAAVVYGIYLRSRFKTAISQE